MSVVKSIKEGMDSGHGNAIVYAGVIGLVLSDVIPTPADALYFYAERNLRDKWKRGEITPEKYWSRSAAYYYSFNPIWWALVGTLIFTMKGDAKQKLKTLGMVIGAGAVLAVLHKNIVSDKKELVAEKISELPLG